MWRRAAICAALMALALPASAAASPSWQEGPIAETSIYSCIQDIPQFGTGAFLAYYADPAAPPHTGDVYYLSVVVSGLGNNCAGTIFDVNLTLPAGTTTAISASDPLTCWAYQTGHPPSQPTAGMCNGITKLNDGSIRINSASAWAGSFNNTPIAPDFPIAMGWTEEMHLPVVSSLPLAGQKVQGTILTTDISPAPTLYPYVEPTVVASTSSSTTSTHTSSSTTRTSISYTLLPPTWTIILPPRTSQTTTATSSQTTQTTVTQVTSTSTAPPTPQPQPQPAPPGPAAPTGGVAGVSSHVPLPATIAAVTHVRVHGRTLSMFVPAVQTIDARFAVCHRRHGRRHCATSATIVRRSAPAGSLRVALPHSLAAGGYQLTVTSGSPQRAQTLTVRVGRAAHRHR